MTAWPMHEAKNKLGTVIDKALTEGPQIVTRRGTDTAVIMSIDEYRRLAGKTKSFGEWLLSCPDVGVDLEEYMKPPLTVRDVDFE